MGSQITSKIRKEIQNQGCKIMIPKKVEIPKIRSIQASPIRIGLSNMMVPWWSLELDCRKLVHSSHSRFILHTVQGIRTPKLDIADSTHQVAHSWANWSCNAIWNESSVVAWRHTQKLSRQTEDPGLWRQKTGRKLTKSGRKSVSLENVSKIGHGFQSF